MLFPAEAYSCEMYMSGGGDIALGTPTLAKSHMCM
jgi:hypothetical protein